MTTVNPEYVQKLIANECDSVKEMLLVKNRKYGNAALEPIRVFSKLSVEEAIRARLDDKLVRIKNGDPSDEEDPEFDIIGYLILKRVNRKLINLGTPATV